MKFNINCGLIGIGVAGGKRLSELESIEGLNLVAVCKKHDTQPHIKVSVPIVLDFYDLINNFSLDAVIISCPYEYAYYYAVEALKNDVHVFCEKPVGFLSKQLGFLENIEQNSKSKMVVNYARRYSKLWHHAKELIETGRIGVPYNAHFNWTRPLKRIFCDSKSNFRSIRKIPGGAFLDVGSHIIDSCFFLNIIKGETKVIKAQLNVIHNFYGELDLGGTVGLISDSGCDISINLCDINLNRKVEMMAEIKCEKGSIHLYEGHGIFDLNGQRYDIVDQPIMRPLDDIKNLIIGKHIFGASVKEAKNVVALIESIYNFANFPLGNKWTPPILKPLGRTFGSC
jgi:predicted dehydrogenase